jgi:protein-S-isoprenylcysteine O-methyltransferase Ste14
MNRANNMVKKILPPTYLLVALILILLLHFIFSIANAIKIPWNLIGLLPLILGVVLNLIADNAYKRSQTTVKPFLESNALITDGVYRLCRHPMYLGFVLILIGVSLMLGSVSPYIVVILFAILMDVVFIRVEESMLEDKFQREWKEYKSKVRKWI